MPVNGSGAIIPKARGMYAKRITRAEYEELMRKRTVPEVASLLKKHPYFSDSLSTLSTADPHRGQLEELLTMDIFKKYEELVHYDFDNEGFSAYYLTECEIKQLLRLLHLIGIGNPGAFLPGIPHYLVGRVRIDLYRLAKCRSLRDVAEALRFTPYYPVLKKRLDADPSLRDFPATEAALLRFFYEDTFARARKSFSGRELESVENLFKRQAEIYNVNLVLRIKVYFPKAYKPEDIPALLMPYTFRITKRQMNALVMAETQDAVLNVLASILKRPIPAPISPEEMDAEGERTLNTYAARLLRLTTSPAAALAAFVTLAKQEYQNVVNIIEGVRYGLPPEKIRVLLYY